MEPPLSGPSCLSTQHLLLCFPSSQPHPLTFPNTGDHQALGTRLLRVPLTLGHLGGGVTFGCGGWDRPAGRGSAYLQLCQDDHPGVLIVPLPLLVLGVHAFPLGLGDRDRQRAPRGEPAPAPPPPRGPGRPEVQPALRLPPPVAAAPSSPLEARSGPGVQSLSDWEGPAHLAPLEGPLHLLKGGGELPDEVMLPTGVVVPDQALRNQPARSLGSPPRAQPAVLTPACQLARSPPSEAVSRHRCTGSSATP